MNVVTLIYAYYENPTMLRMHLRAWRNYQPMYRGKVRIIVVDDGSQDDHAMDIIVGRAHVAPYPDLQLYRVLNDTPWAQDGARNIAMSLCQTDWALMSDMDHVVTPEQIGHLLRMTPAGRCYYMPYRKTSGNVRYPHPNTFLMNVQDFWDMGGYDEDFCGFYGSDGNFRKCCRGAGMTEIATAEFYMEEYKHTQIPDAHTRRYGRKDSQYYAGSNPALNAKRMGPAYKAVNPLRQPYERLL